MEIGERFLGYKIDKCVNKKIKDIIINSFVDPDFYKKRMDMFVIDEVGCDSSTIFCSFIRNFMIDRHQYKTVLYFNYIDFCKRISFDRENEFADSLLKRRLIMFDYVEKNRFEDESLKRFFYLRNQNYVCNVFCSHLKEEDFVKVFNNLPLSYKERKNIIIENPII